MTSGYKICYKILFRANLPENWGEFSCTNYEEKLSQKILHHGVLGFLLVQGFNHRIIVTEQINPLTKPLISP